MKKAFKRTFTSTTAEPFLFGVIVTSILHYLLYPFIKIHDNAFLLMIGAIVTGASFLFLKFLFYKFIRKDKNYEEIFSRDPQTELDYIPQNEYELKKVKTRKNKKITEYHF